MSYEEVEMKTEVDPFTKEINAEYNREKMIEVEHLEVACPICGEPINVKVDFNPDGPAKRKVEEERNCLCHMKKSGNELKIAEKVSQKIDELEVVE